LTNATWTKNYRKNLHNHKFVIKCRNRLEVWGHEEARRSKEHKRIDRGRVAVL
jgi:hypothetical protein